MSQRQSGYPRQPNETYETPSWVVQVATQYLRKHCLHIWAPADEESSRLVLALRAEGFTVTATADDFLVRTCLPHSRIDAVTTNPPFGQGGRLACQFIAHALELVPIVAMLLRIDACARFCSKAAPCPFFPVALINGRPPRGGSRMRARTPKPLQGCGRFIPAR